MRPVEKVNLDPMKVFNRAEEIGMSKTEMSNRCGYTDAWVYNAVSRPMNRPKAELLANVLGVSLEDISPDARVLAETVSEPTATVKADLDISNEIIRIEGALERLNERINALNLTVSSRGYRIAEALEKIAQGISEPWEERND